MEHECDGDINCNWCTRGDHIRLAKGVGRVGKLRTGGDHLKSGIVKVGQNTEKSPGDMRRLTVTQIPSGRPPAKLAKSKIIIKNI